MNRHTYVRLPGATPKEELLHWSGWLPRLQQMAAAAQLQLADAVDPFERGHVTATMRQGLGLIVVFGLIAGIVPLIANLWVAVPQGSAVPLAQAAAAANRIGQAYAGIAPVEIAANTVQSVAGLRSPLPGLLAALLSALGLWINWPLTWLAAWIIYGTLVMGLARLMGAANTLDTFFAATAFTAVPLLLLGLEPVPLIGPLLALAALLWGFVLYYRAVRFVTRLDEGRTLLAMLLPPALVILAPLALGVAGWLAVRL